MANTGSLALRPATPDDAAYLVDLRSHPDTATFLAVLDQDEADLRAELAASDAARSGRLIASRGERHVGALKWTLVNRRSRIAELSEVIVDPGARGGGIGAAMTQAAARLLVERHNVHRVQLEVYGDNHAAQRAFQRAGFRREGVRRQAYWRRGAWQDGVLYGLLSEEL